MAQHSKSSTIWFQPTFQHLFRLLPHLSSPGQPDSFPHCPCLIPHHLYFSVHTVPLAQNSFLLVNEYLVDQMLWKTYVLVDWWLTAFLSSKSLQSCHGRDQNINRWPLYVGLYKMKEPCTGYCRDEERDRNGRLEEVASTLFFKWTLVTDEKLSSIL